MRNILISVVFAASCISCNKYVKFAQPAEVAAGVQWDGTITLDATYQLYTRSVYKTYQQAEHVLKSMRRGAQLRSDTLVELEYMLISHTDSNVIYISTICDQYQLRYIGRDEPLRKINVFDYKVLLFGKLVDQNTVTFFMDGTDTYDRWALNWNSDKSLVSVAGVNEYINNEFYLYIPASESLEEPCQFIKVDNWEMEYRVYDDDVDGPVVPVLTGPLRFRNRARANAKRRRYRMYIGFDQPIRQGSSTTTVFFTSRRIGSEPDQLFD